MATLSFFQDNPLDSVILQLHSCESLEQLENFILNELPEELGASFASWNEHNDQLNLTRVANSTSHEDLIAPLVEDLNRSLPSHPLFPKYFNFQRGEVVYCDCVDRTRAEVSDEEFYQLPFYRDVARHLKLEDQLIMHVFIQDGSGILLTFHGERLFTEAQQIRAAILRGHIIARLHTIKQEQAKAKKAKKAALSEVNKVLSAREIEVMRLVCLGNSNQQIADALDVTKRTAETHVSNILQRLELDSRYRLIARYGQWLLS